jgi:hypothetical protein
MLRSIMLAAVCAVAVFGHDTKPVIVAGTIWMPL